MHVFSFISSEFRHGEAERAEAANEELCRKGIALRQFFRPGVLAFLSLALAVGGWAYGNKLSHYRHIYNVTAASSPRIWVDHRHMVPGAQVQHGRAIPKIISLQALSACIPDLSRLCRWLHSSAPHPARVPFSSSSLVPLRAPPISGSSLA